MTRSTRSALTLGLSAILIAGACDAADPGAAPRAATPTPAPASAPEVAASPDGASIAVASENAVRAAPPAAPDAVDPDAPVDLRALAPTPTRAGHLRLADPRIGGDDGAKILLERLADAGVSDDERRALAEALPRSGGAWSSGALERLAVEGDEAVRAILVRGLRRASAAEARAAVELGLGDASGPVRQAALEVAGWVPEVGAATLERVRAALADQEARVRAEAARALGLLGDRLAFDALVGLVGDSDIDVRVQALHALERIDRAKAATLPAILAARDDADETVRRAAARLLGAP